MPGGVITEHVHPHQEERFTITTGQARFTLAGDQHTARAGETVVVPAGVAHSEGNAGSVDVDGVVELRPALHSKEWHEALAGLVADGHTTPRGAPKNPLQLGATFWHFRHESRATSPPIWLQNLMLPPLAALARLFGVHPYHHRWDTRIEPSPRVEHRTDTPVSAPMVIDQLEAVQLGDTTQWIRVRGTDANNPVLLLIQQGPGLPMLNEVRRFEHLLGLEKDFTVVYWDQRGCGRSWGGRNRAPAHHRRSDGE